MAESKDCLLDEMLESLLLMDSCILQTIAMALDVLRDVVWFS